MEPREAAVEYAKMGYKVFPLLPKTKIPKRGFSWPLEASNNPAVVGEHFVTWMNVAIKTGKDSGPGNGFFVLDVDVKDNGPFSLQCMLDEHGDFEMTPVAKTGGGGYHYLFKIPEGMEVRNKTKFLPGLDIRGTGGYIVVYPSVHESENIYQWEEGNSVFDVDPTNAPQWLLDHACAPEQDLTPIELDLRDDGEATIFDKKEILSALASMDADSDFENSSHGKHGYQAWRDIGMALAYELGMEGGYGPWLAWCQQGSKGKFQDMDPQKMWRSFNPTKRLEQGIEPVTMGTIISLAEDCFDWVYEGHDEGIDLSRILEKKEDSGLALIKEEKERKKKIKKAAAELASRYPSIEHDASFPEELLKTGGIMEEISTWIQEYGFLSPHELALGSSISIVAALAGRRYETPTGGGLATYTVGIGGSSAGKNAGLVMASNLLTKAGFGAYVGGSGATSDSAFHDMLLEHPSKTLIWDEIGEKFAGMMDPKRGSRVLGVIDKMLTCWSCGVGTLADKEMSKRSSHHKQREAVEHPNLVIYGVATPASMDRAVKRSDIVNGFFPRFLLFNVRSRAKPNMNASSEPPKRLMRLLQSWHKKVVGSSGMKCGGVDMGISVESSRIIPKKKKVAWTQEGLSYYSDKIDTMRLIQEKHDSRGEEVAATIHGKVCENALRLASIRAVSRDPVKPEALMEDLKWGFEIAERSTVVMLEYASTVSDNDHEKHLLTIEKLIRTSGEDGITMREIGQRSRMVRARDRNDFLSDLVRIGVVSLTKTGKKRVYRWIETV